MQYRFPSLHTHTLKFSEKVLNKKWDNRTFPFTERVSKVLWPVRLWNGLIKGFILYGRIKNKFRIIVLDNLGVLQA